MNRKTDDYGDWKYHEMIDKQAEERTMPNDITLHDFHQCCRQIIANKNSKALNYCVNYALAGLHMEDEYEAKVQALYILNNMTHWRGEVAKATRATLKAFSK